MKTSKEDYGIFKSECHKWIKRFGLFGWEVFYTHIKEKGNHMAGFDTAWYGRCSTINLSTEISGSIKTDFHIKKSAFHEIIEGLLFARIGFLARDRCTSDLEIEEEIHNLVRVFEEVIFCKEFKEEEGNE